VKSYDGHPTVAGAIGGWTMVLAGSVLFFLAALGTPEGYVPRWLTYLGRISFGLYMFHSLVFHLVFQFVRPSIERHLGLSLESTSVIGIVLVLAITIVIAGVSYRYFERPFLKLKERFTFVRSRPE
jgi:peptidoglycan/LPS O-acetylase OafA/YrhL